MNEGIEHKVSIRTAINIGFGLAAGRLLWKFTYDFIGQVLEKADEKLNGDKTEKEGE